MSEQNNERLIFWSFFKRIEAELSYERWIDKYLLFEATVMGHYLPYDDNWTAFRRFCKALYLQNQNDEVKFDQILTEAIEEEKKYFLSLLVKEEISPVRETTPTLQEGTPAASQNNETPLDTSTNEGQTDGQETGETNNQIKTIPYYFNPQLREDFTPTHEATGINTAFYPSANFLFTDEYFPVTRRQMSKAWQYLRRKEPKGWSNKINLVATIKEIARQGMFLQPTFHRGMENKKDTLIIFADCRGSMTPFAEYTQRLIHSAKHNGGHSQAPVYYFQNYPLGVLYQQPNLSEPIKISEALAHTNPQGTIAIIISDAGAARGYDEENLEKRNTIRVGLIETFLLQLNEKVAHVVWLNPIPKHRWHESAANYINKKNLVSVMAPVFDENYFDFQGIINLLLKQKKQ
jgi:uncharacterized protein